MSNKYGLSDEYWDNLSSKGRAMYDIVRPMPVGQSISWQLRYVESSLEDAAKIARDEGGDFNLCPEFQRGNVWTMQQRESYMESYFRGMAPKEIKVNCPWYSSNYEEGAGDIPKYSFYVIDGLQRLTTFRMFLRGEVTAFGMAIGEFVGTPFEVRGFSHQLSVMYYSIPNMKELIQFYLDLNSGGTVHSAEELARVKLLMK